MIRMPPSSKGQPLMKIRIVRVVLSSLLASLLATLFAAALAQEAPDIRLYIFDNGQINGLEAEGPTLVTKTLASQLQGIGYSYDDIDFFAMSHVDRPRQADTCRSEVRA